MGLGSCEPPKPANKEIGGKLYSKRWKLPTLVVEWLAQLKHIFLARVTKFHADFLHALKRSRVTFSKRFIVPTIDSELHLSFGEQ
jgi:hypothetical protein